MTTTNADPQHQTRLSAGADICSNETVTIGFQQTKLVSTGYRIPEDWKKKYQDYCIMLYPRSSLALKTGLLLANSVGIIDIDYPNEIKVMLFNPTPHNVTIIKGDRIAQLIMQPITRPWPVKDLPRTGGFGSTTKEEPAQVSEFIHTYLEKS